MKNVFILFAGIGTTIDSYMSLGFNVIGVYEPRPFYQETLRRKFEDILIFDFMPNKQDIEGRSADILDISLLDVEKDILAILPSFLEVLTPKEILAHRESNALRSQEQYLLNEIALIFELFDYEIMRKDWDMSRMGVPQLRSWHTMTTIDLNDLYMCSKEAKQVRTSDVLEGLLESNTLETFLNDDWSEWLDKYIHPNITVKELESVSNIDFGINYRLLRRDLWDKPYLNLSIVGLPLLHPLKNRKLSNIEICKLQGISEKYANIPHGYIFESIPTKFHKQIVQKFF